MTESLQGKQESPARAVWQSSMDFVCTWDLGRRCNLDCSYCPPHRHNNWSEHSSLDNLVNTAKLPLRYIQLLREKMGDHLLTMISFTGGEPTLNPDFSKLCDYIKGRDPKIDLSLTTNGLFNDKIFETFIGNIDHVTVSFHFEAPEVAKKKILENIEKIQRYFNEGKLKNYSVNVMVHAQDHYFSECQLLIKYFQTKKIHYSLRTIGEHPKDKSAHLYNEEQIGFIRSNGYTYQKSPGDQSSLEKKNHGNSAGRACCGGRSFKEIFDDPNERYDEEWLQNQPDKKRLEWRKFKNWYCLVNLFFLHIHQEEKKVYYHQTCQAKEDGGRGPIGTTENIDELVGFLESKFQKNSFLPVKCPNEICNCGLCITKSRDKSVIQKFLDAHAPGLSLPL